MIVDLNLAKQYLQVDADDDDDLITLLISAAESYITNATGKTFDSSCALAQLTALKIISVNYSNRNNVLPGRNVLIPNFIQGDIFKLKYYEVGVKNANEVQNTVQ